MTLDLEKKTSRKNDNDEWIFDHRKDLEKLEDIFLCRIPIMLRSEFCVLNLKEEAERITLQECAYDQGGYFIVNGSEKVVVAQEKMCNNFV